MAKETKAIIKKGNATNTLFLNRALRLKPSNVLFLSRYVADNTSNITAAKINKQGIRSRLLMKIDSCLTNPDHNGL